MLDKSVTKTAVFGVKWNPLLYHQYNFICRNLFTEERSKQKRPCSPGFISPYPGQHAFCIPCFVTQLGFTVPKLSKELGDDVPVLPHLHLETAYATKLSRQREEEIRLSFVIIQLYGVAFPPFFNREESFLLLGFFLLQVILVISASL